MFREFNCRRVTKILIVGASLAFCGIGQTSASLRSHYGQPTSETFSVRTGISVTVTYAVNGKASQLRFTPDKFDQSLVGAPIEIMRSAFENLVPYDRRGNFVNNHSIPVSCPPVNDCKGVEEVYEFINVLTVFRKKGTLYILVTLKNIAPPGNMKLLPGYEDVRRQGVDTIVGTIEKVGGLVIRYDIGRLAGNYAQFASSKPSEIDWSRSEKVNGDSVLIVYTKDKFLTASFEKSFANFTGKAATRSDIDDFLNMVLTYDPKYEPK